MRAMRWFLLLIISASAVWAQPLTTDYRQTFDFSAAPVTLTAGGALMLNVDYGEEFASYEDIFLQVTFQNSTKHITTQGLLLSNQASPPSYASATEWGYAVMTGSSQSATPSTSFSWNSGYGSEHWLNVGADEIALETLDGQFTFYFQNAPLSQSPGLTSKEDLIVLSAEVVVRGATVAPAPAPVDADGDGVNNYREDQDGTNPNDANSFNPLSKGLVAYYPFDGNANDESGLSNNISASDLVYEDGRNCIGGTAVGLTKGFSASRTIYMEQQAPRTFSQWVKVVEYPATSDPGWVRPSVSVAAYPQSVILGNVFAADGEWWMDTGSGVAFYDFPLSTNWVNVTIVYQGNGPESKVYRNGVEVPLKLWLGNKTYFDSGEYNPLVVLDQVGGTTNTSSKNLIDEVRVYNRALSDSEVKRLYYETAFSVDQRDFLVSNPTVQGHFSLTEYNANRTNGQTDVTTNPAAFNLFTQSQFAGNRTAGQQDVIASPMTYGLYDSTSIMDLRMGGLMIQKQGTSATVFFQPQTTTNLTSVPFADSGPPITKTFEMPGNKGFLRVQALAAAPDQMITVQGGTLPQSSQLAGTVVETFRIGKYEVTWGEWQEVRSWAVKNGYSDLDNVGLGSAVDHPVRDVSWFDALKWMNAKSEKEGFTPVYQISGEVYRTGQSVPSVVSTANGYRLPAEAEWEWAARGGVSSQDYIYSGSNDVNAVAWHWENSVGASVVLYYFGNRGTWPVGQKMPNELGIHDMSGSVWEWIFDEYESYRRKRGGSWGDFGFNGAVADRGRYYDYTPETRVYVVGFRLARKVP